MSGHAEDRISARVVDAWGHFAPEVLCASIAAAILIGLRPPDGPLALTLPVSLMALVVCSWLLMRRHDRRLCEQCVASLPLNAAERAGRYRSRFWVSHSLSEPRYLVPYLAALVGSNFLPGTWGRVVWALAQCTMIYLIMSYVTHRRLQPWCPWCSDGGGGSHHEDVAPPPLPDNDRQLV
jgi:hypothetical protein